MHCTSLVAGSATETLSIDVGLIREYKVYIRRLGATSPYAYDGALSGGISIFTKLLKAKLHQAVVTQTDLNYHGSITIDSDLLRATGLLPNEAVLIADCENGNRFETYIIPGPAGSGVMGINGAAARLTAVGNRIIVMAFVDLAPEEIEKHVAKIVVCDKGNRIVERIEQRSTLKA